MSPTTGARPSTPQSRVVRNGDRLLDAAVAIAAKEGWPGLTFLRVAERAELSRRTLQDRWDGPPSLMAATWEQRCAPALERLLADALAAAGLLGAEPDHPLGDVIAAAARPGPLLRASAELLLVAQFEPALHDAVGATTGALVAAWTAPAPGRVTRSLAAQRAYVVGLVLGLVLMGRRPGIATLDLRTWAPTLEDALGRPTRPTRLPLHGFAHLDAPVPFGTGDPTTDSLLQAALDAIGRHGFDGATVEQIATAAGSSQGALFSRWASKSDLVVEATGRQNALALRANQEAMAAIAAQHGAGAAEAVALREFQRPTRGHLRAITLENIRMAWHDPRLLATVHGELVAFEDELRAAGTISREEFHVGQALGVGVLAVPILAPDCWALPYDVVTVPLAEGPEVHGSGR